MSLSDLINNKNETSNDVEMKDNNEKQINEVE